VLLLVTVIINLTTEEIEHMRTLKEIRKQLDNGLIDLSEVIGESVKIGFMALVIEGYEETPKDCFPNVWHLSANEKKYEFTPYNGLYQVCSW